VTVLLLVEQLALLVYFVDSVLPLFLPRLPIINILFNFNILLIHLPLFVWRGHEHFWVYSNIFHRALGLVAKVELPHVLDVITIVLELASCTTKEVLPALAGTQ
jgi:hypothetical protein